MLAMTMKAEISLVMTLWASFEPSGGLESILSLAFDEVSTSVGARIAQVRESALV